MGNTINRLLHFCPCRNKGTKEMSLTQQISALKFGVKFTPAQVIIKKSTEDEKNLKISTGSTTMKIVSSDSCCSSIVGQTKTNPQNPEAIEEKVVNTILTQNSPSPALLTKSSVSTSLSKSSTNSKLLTHIYNPEKGYWEHIKPFKLQGTPWTLIGYSVAARHTCFRIPELDLNLDAGVPCNQATSFHFITHGHLDHCGCLPNSLFEISPKGQPVIVVPNPIKELMKNYIHNTFVLTKNNPNTTIHNKYKLIGAKAGESFTLKVKNMNWKIEVFKCNHTVPTSGYGFVEIRNKLKEEYKSLSQEEINKLREEKVCITEEKEYPLFCFLGDTDHKVFEDDRLKKYKTIIVECTFFEKTEDKVPSKKNKNISELALHASKCKHMYWDNLKPIVKQRSDTLFILTHFSYRYTQKEIHDFFSSQNLANILPWA